MDVHFHPVLLPFDHFYFVDIPEKGVQEMVEAGNCKHRTASGHMLTVSPFFHKMVACHRTFPSLRYNSDLLFRRPKGLTMARSNFYLV